MRFKVLVFSLFIIAALVLSLCASNPKNTGKVPNPSATYCQELGYNYTIVDTEKGQVGYCKFPDGSNCSAWSFFKGKCGEEHTYCEKHGGNITTTTEGCAFSQECAVCILPNGTRCHEWDYFKGECP